MAELGALALLLTLSVIVPARPDKRFQQETFASFWTRHVPHPRKITPRKVSLTALASHGNTIWWAFLLAWPTVRTSAVALWWALRLAAWILAGLAHMALKLTPHVIKAAILLLAALWIAAKWLVWHIDQLTATPEPSNAPQLATA
ncbi:hypothetical protein [Nonomuraea sp. NPDC005650]|uniref:hypothetical protein n=1 Tax=Nonomuraea sp. NPDC005650 TaxID=3157045 RepID=UPI0033B54178